MEPKSEEKAKPLVSLIRLLALPFKYKAASGILAFASVLACVYALKGIGLQLSVSLTLAAFLLIPMVVFYLSYLSILGSLKQRPAQNQNSTPDKTEI